MSSYWKNIKVAFDTTLGGLKLTFRHLLQAKRSRKPVSLQQEDYFNVDTGLFTVQYPKEAIPVPDNGRYRLHNEIDDCIVCDKCAKICPVNCIEIEPIRSAEEFGKTSDGTPKRIYAAKFDIDMGKCCFCGLCTTVCPTECLTMTKAFDFSEYDIRDHVYVFGDMTPEDIKEKQLAFEQYQVEKEAQKAAKPAKSGAPATAARPRPTTGAKPAFKAKVAPARPRTEQSEDQNTEKAKPVFRPKMKTPNKQDGDATNDSGSQTPKPQKRPQFKPKIKPKNQDGDQ